MRPSPPSALFNGRIILDRPAFAPPSLKIILPTGLLSSIRRDPRATCTAALMLFCLLWHLPTLTLTPGVNHDEIMLNAAAREWTARGHIALMPLAERGATYATAYYWHPPGHLLTMAGAYQLFGFSIATTRGVSLAYGLIAVALLYNVLASLRVPPVPAMMATLLFMAHPLVWFLCRSGRMDLAAISFGLAAILVICPFLLGEASPRRAALGGLLVGVGALFHVLILVWVPALIMAESFRRRTFPWKNAVLIASIATLPLMIWIMAAFLSGQGAAWQEQFLGYQLGQRTAHTPVWRRVPDEIGLLISQFRYLPLIFPLLLAGLFYGWNAVSPARRWSAIAAGTAFLLIALATGKGAGAYPLYWFVWLLPVIIAGAYLLRPRPRFWLVTLALANAAAVQLTFSAVAWHQRAGRNTARVDRFFAAHIPPDSLVLGPEDIWYALEHAGARLRIWGQPDPRRYAYFVTSANIPALAPAGYELVAELTDIMPKVFGHYWSHTSSSYRIWGALAAPAGLPVTSSASP